MATEGARAVLAELAARARPASLAREQVLPVVGALRPLLPDGLPRGATVAVAGSTALALALAAGPAGAGSWVAGVGLAALGLAAAHHLGVPLDRLVLVRPPDPRSLVAAVAAAVDGFDVVLVRSSPVLRPADVRRLQTRARSRGTVLLPVEGAGGSRWPEAPDARLEVRSSRWQGLGEGAGHLQARRVEVAIEGRRSLSRPRRAVLWLPGVDGAPAAGEGALDDVVVPFPRAGATGPAAHPAGGGRAGAGPGGAAGAWTARLHPRPVPGASTTGRGSDGVSDDRGAGAAGAPGGDLRAVRTGRGAGSGEVS